MHWFLSRLGPCIFPTGLNMWHISGVVSRINVPSTSILSCILSSFVKTEEWQFISTSFQSLKDARARNLTPQNNTHVLRKIDLRLLPLLLGIHFLQQLDKTTLSYASVFGLIEKANLHGQQYSWLGSVVYLAQLVVQPLVAYILVKVPLGKFLACTIVLWGIALSCMTASNDFVALLVCRMFLGAFEAGIRKFFFFFQFAMKFVLLMLIAPAFIAITQMWYRRLEQPVRLGSWYVMNGVVNMVSWLLSCQQP